MARTLSPLLVLLALATVAPSVGAATPPPLQKTGGPDVGIVLIDRGRYVFWEQTGAVIAQDDERQTRISAALPSGCTLGGSFAVRYPWALVLCAEGPRVLNVGTGVANRPAGIPPQPSLTMGCDQRPYYPRIGARWLAFRCQGYDFRSGGALGYVNWRTGAAMSSSLDPDTANLDGDQPKPADGPPGCDLRKPWAYQHDARVVLDQNYLSDDRRIRVRRCDGTRFTTLSDCRPACGYAQLSGAAITWTEGRWVKAYDTRTRRRFTWRISAKHPSARSTTSAVWVTADGRVYRAGL